MARKVPEINSSSQADIAFLLLCFFLMTTSMDVDYGIMRRLPPLAQENQDDKFQANRRNVMEVKISQKDQLLINGKVYNRENVGALKDMVIDFMTPKPGNDNAPEVEKKTIQVGDKSYIEVMTSKGIISLQNHDNTSYEMYIKVQDQLSLAFNELRNREANRQFGKDYLKLDDDQTKAINDAVPVRVSETDTYKATNQ